MNMQIMKVIIGLTILSLTSFAHAKVVEVKFSGTVSSFSDVAQLGLPNNSTFDVVMKFDNQTAPVKVFSNGYKQFNIISMATFYNESLVFSQNKSWGASLHELLVTENNTLDAILMNNGRKVEDYSFFSGLPSLARLNYLETDVYSNNFSNDLNLFDASTFGLVDSQNPLRFSQIMDGPTIIY